MLNINESLYCIGKINSKSQPNATLNIDYLVFDSKSKENLFNMVNNKYQGYHGITNDNQKLFVSSLSIPKTDYKLLSKDTVYSGNFEALLKSNNQLSPYRLFIDAFTIGYDANTLSFSDNNANLKNINMVVLATKPIVFEEINE